MEISQLSSPSLCEAQIKQGKLRHCTQTTGKDIFTNPTAILTLTSSFKLQVRLRVLQIISSFLDKKGENYLSVMPDSAPLMAEALEDDDVRVEKSCQKLMKKMEEVFGHSVESYFE